MDLFDEDLLEEKKKVKKIGKGIIIAAVIVVILIIGVVIVMSYLQSQKLGAYVDGTQINFAADTYYVEDTGKIYISIKNVAKTLGYNYYNGEYGKASEDDKKGFVEKLETEAVSFETNSKKIYKTVLKDKTDTLTNNESNYMYIDEPIKYINGKLYTTMEGINEIYNVKISYNQDKNKFVMYTLPYLVTSYTSTVANYGYKELAPDFVNQKAMASDMLVVRREDGKMGVINPDGTEIIGAKYSNITYLETTNEFVVENNNKVGLVNNLGTTKISLDYDQIRLLDNDSGLYIAKSNDYYGVLNKQGDKIIYLEYDSIGIDNSLYNSSDITNPYLLYNTCIPVQKNKKWGLYDKTGKLVLPIEFDMMGCVISTGQTASANNALLLSDYEAIIVGKILREDDQDKKKYAVYNALGDMLVDLRIDSIYYIIQNGKEIYEMEVDGKRGNVDDVFKQNGISKINKDIIDTTQGSGDININQNIISNGTQTQNVTTENTQQGGQEESPTSEGQATEEIQE